MIWEMLTAVYNFFYQYNSMVALYQSKNGEHRTSAIELVCDEI